MPMKKYKVNNKNQNKSGKLKAFISIWSFKLKKVPLWVAYNIQIPNLRSWWNEVTSSTIFENICTGS